MDAFSPGSVYGFSSLFRSGPVPLAFVPNQRRLRLNDGEIGMLRPGRKCEGRAQGNVNDRRSDPSDSTSHHWCTK